MAARKVVLPGGSGYLGQHLAQRLVARGDDVTVLTRGASGRRDGVTRLPWDGRTSGPWVSALRDADAVVHLAGRRVDVRPTRRNVDELVASRVQSVRVVGEALARTGRRLPVWVQVGTMAIFGEGGDEVITESSTPSGIGPRQMVTVAMAWEQAYRLASTSAERRVLLRCGVALGPGDPALSQLVLLSKLGLGGPIGDGRQWVSWIALDDLLNVLLRVVDDDSMAGTYHLTAPRPVRNAELMAAVRAAVGRQRGLPNPALITQVGAWLLGSDPALALTGRRGVPARLLEAGVSFQHPEVTGAIRRALAG